MPLYEYECEACGQRFEVIQKFSDPPADRCTACGKGPVRRLLSSPAIQFKGSGWYVTDYAQKGKSEPKADAAPAKAETKSDARTDTKADKTAETKSSETKTPAPAKD